MITINGKLILDSPVYRGNATKTLFSRQSDDSFIELAGKVTLNDSAMALMDGFLVEQAVMRKKNRQEKPVRRTPGILDQIWRRLYGEEMPQNLVEDVSCRLDLGDRNPNERFFDLRMGIAIDRDTMTQQYEGHSGMNYKLETVSLGQEFTFKMTCNQNLNPQHYAKLAGIIAEMTAGRFYFGAGKSRGLGKCRLVLDADSQAQVDQWPIQAASITNQKSNQITIKIEFDGYNPFLVGWPWGVTDNNGQDTWIDKEQENRQAHIELKKAVLEGKSDQEIRSLPGGREFIDSHPKAKRKNFGKSIQNDDRLIKFLCGYRDKVITELRCQHNRDYRVRPGTSIVEQSDKWYDRVFMRMLCWRINPSPIIAPDDINLKRLKKDAMEALHRKKAHDVLDNDILVKIAGNCQDLELRQLILHKYQDKAQTPPLTKVAKPTWELYIPGSTFKGAFRVRAQQLLRTLSERRACQLYTPSDRGRCDRDCPVCVMFGKQNDIAQIWFSDAYLLAPEHPLAFEAQCAMDAIQIDPKTGKPVESAKMDFLYAYGDKLKFEMTIKISDLAEGEIWQLGYLLHLIRDFQNGYLPIGGQKTSGLGWLDIADESIAVEILCAQGNWLESVAPGEPCRDSLWHKFSCSYSQFLDQFADRAGRAFTKKIVDVREEKAPHTIGGKISHQQFGGYCGSLFLNVEVMSPLHISESGEPAYMIDNKQCFDFFSMAPPSASSKKAKREYAIPAKTIKGAVRSIYTAITDADQANCLFGYVKEQDSEAYMGRVVFHFAHADDVSWRWCAIKRWYKEFVLRKKQDANYRYKNIRCYGHRLNFAPELLIALGKNCPPSLAQVANINDYDIRRFAQPGSIFRLQVDINNLSKAEFGNLLFALCLDSHLHKIGKSKAVGLGSCRISLESYEQINFIDRYSSLDDDGIDVYEDEDLEELVQRLASARANQAISQLCRILPQ